ncbi:MAG: family 78 glycoside hydrolase catalytic domain [Caldilineaceae bacterium]
MTQFVRRAEWIWRWRGLHKLAFMGSEPPFAEERNRYLYFRKSIDLTATVKETQVFVSADGRYQLFVNGQRVGRGPVRCAPAFQSLDYYNLAPFLRPGANHIVALVHSYGRHTAWYELPAMEQARAFGCGGFFLQGDVETEVGTLCLDTGTSWHCLEAAAWQRESPSCSLGFNEIYDARLAWNGLTPEYNPDLDPNDWQPVEVLRVPARNFADDIVPFPNLVVSDLPPMSEAEELPVAVVSIHEVEDDNSTNDVATLFANQPLQRLQTCQVSQPNALLSHEHATEIVTLSNRSVSFVIDFGQVVTGRLQFEVEGTAGTQIDFTYGERLEDGGRVRSIAGIPGLDAPVAHRYILAEGRQRWQQFERAGFRYVQVSVRKATIPLRIHWLTLMSSSYPAKERGEFRCSDPLLTQIWRTGVETLRRCMHDGYEDCPGREQRQWVGDAYTMLLINYAAFGDVRLARRFLRQVAQSQRGDGLTAVMTPGDFSIRNTFNIPDFCLYWIMALANHVECSGDLALADELFPSVLRAIAWFERYLDQDDLLNDVPHWVFVDWAEIDKRGQVSALNAHFVATLRFAAKLARQIVEERQARRLESIAERVTRAINQHLWDEERGVYVDARRNQKRSRRVSQQTNAMMIAYDVAPKARWDRILARILDEQRLVLTRTGDADPHTIPFDEEEQIVLAQPFTMHHLHRALQQAGRHTTMLDNIRQRWGAWVEAGEATFWESWQLNPITSLCHAWSGTPTHDLTAYVLGVTPDGTTLRSVQIAPNPAGLRWAEGIAPTPYGDIAVAWHWEVDHFELAVELPLDMQATLRLPTVISEHATSISLNDAPLHEKRVRLQTGKHRLVAVMR